MKTRRSAVSPTCQDSPIYWFLKFEGAIGRGDLVLARTAQDQLRRLGYSVGHHRSAPKKREPR